jgi:hypothetical protein
MFLPGVLRRFGEERSSCRFLNWIALEIDRGSGVDLQPAARCSVTKNALTNFLLFTIAIALIAIAVRPYIYPAPAQAQSMSANSLYIEPGVQMLRAPNGSGQVYGKMVVDLRTGKIWGFPTGTLDAYPSNPMDNKPTTSHPFALGKFAFEDIDK